MSILLRAALCIGCLAALAIPARAQQAPAEIAGQITVIGTGAVVTTPDLLRITIGVQADAETASEAIREMSASMDAILANLSEAGISGADIRTAGLNLSPRYDDRYSSGSAPVAQGFIAGTDATITVRELDRAGAVLDAVVAAGANQIYGLEFDSSERTALTDQARRAAVADAISKTTLYATAANLDTGAILSIQESGAGGGPMFEASAMAARDVPIATGTFAISAQVTVVTAID